MFRNAVFATIGVMFSIITGASGAQASVLWHNCPVAAYEEASRVVVEMREGVDQGIFSGSDLMAAEVLMLDAGYCAGRIAKQEFCARKSEIIERYAESIRRLRDQDISSLGGRQVLVSWMAEHATVCAGR